MTDFLRVMREIFANAPIANRLARFNVKSRWADNYLGSIWDYLEPTIYIGTYFLIFGMGMYNGTVNGQPYILWLLTGIIPWYFIQGSFNKGLNSIKSQLGLLTKIRFPMSVAPVMPMLEELRRFFFMTIAMIVILLAFGEMPNVHWLQFVYAFVAMFATVLAHNLINSTLTVVIPDYKPAMSALFRLLFFTSGVIINMDAKHLPFVLVTIIKMFPFYYVLESFRDAFLYHVWFWDKASNALFFWLLTLLMLMIGSMIHLRFRDRFIDMV
ncbi:teichoic acid translocation permease [Weissella cibaria]|uniref:Teichoic acid translocation permease n=1 Tax=Weissella cibaria TaxID=137591 RepID=A0A1X4JMP5_9LACO|nr:ABC transporter permease [Weissella cibaria]MCT8400615.1 ABC transporter permease [Weissella cibaria]MDH5011547.1 ABC transporter permease [Weissella cibaria]OSP89958.1 teichoic acid translocation permease [Weissella cibaria]